MKIRKHNPYRSGLAPFTTNIEDNPLLSWKFSEILNFVDDHAEIVRELWNKRHSENDYYANPEWLYPRSLAYCPLILVILSNYRVLKVKICKSIDSFDEQSLSIDEEEQFLYEIAQLELFCSVIIHCFNTPPRVTIKSSDPFNPICFSNWSKRVLGPFYIVENGENYFKELSLIEKEKVSKRPPLRIIKRENHQNVAIMVINNEIDD